MMMGHTIMPGSSPKGFGDRATSALGGSESVTEILPWCRRGMGLIGAGERQQQHRLDLNEPTVCLLSGN